MRDTIDALALLKGAAVGLAAGLIASLAMNQFQAAVASLSSGEDKGEPSTEKAADRISRAVEGEPLADGRKAVAGNLSIMRWVPPWGLPMASQRRSGRGSPRGSERRSVPVSRRCWTKRRFLRQASRPHLLTYRPSPMSMRWSRTLSSG